MYLVTRVPFRPVPDTKYTAHSDRAFVMESVARQMSGQQPASVKIYNAVYSSVQVSAKMLYRDTTSIVPRSRLAYTDAMFSSQTPPLVFIGLISGL